MKYSFVLLPRAVCVVAKKTLGSLKAVPSPLASFLDPFPGELTRWRPTELLAELHKFHKSQTSPWNPSGRGRGKGPRRRTLRVRELKKKQKQPQKLEAFFSLHINRVVLALSSLPPLPTADTARQARDENFSQMEEVTVASVLEGLAAV